MAHLAQVHSGMRHNIGANADMKREIICPFEVCKLTCFNGTENNYCIPHKLGVNDILNEHKIIQSVHKYVVSRKKKPTDATASPYTLLHRYIFISFFIFHCYR